MSLRGSLLVAALVAAVGVLGRGGELGGDPAVYAWQAAHGVLGERTIHVGYVAILALGEQIGLSASLGGDLLTVLSAASIVVGAARINAEAPTWAALGAAAVVLPWASWAEVDLPWVAALVLAIGDPRGRALLVALAVSLSPTALLALPWAAVLMGWDRGRLRDLLAPAILTVLTLTVLGGGDWWWGDRGVLAAPSPRLLRSASRWLFEGVPWLVVAATGPRVAWLATLPLLLAPPDIPAWLPLGLTAAMSLRPGTLTAVLLAGQLLVAGTQHHARRERLLADAVEIATLAEELDPEDGLVAPWTVGVRVSLIREGDPYAARWIADPPVRDQRARWCADPPARVVRARDVSLPDCGLTDP